MKIAGFLLALPMLPLLAVADCSVTNVGITPLPELGFQKYKGFAGGLYPHYANQPPPTHLAAGVSIAENEIKPLNAAGNVDTNNGKIVLLSLGMSNTTQEWNVGDTITGDKTRAFKFRADHDPSKNPKLIIVDGAIGGRDAPDWTNADAPTWSMVITQRLVQAGVTTNQVQAMWLKQALASPRNYGDFPLHAQALQNDLASILRIARAKYPNLKLVYLSGRTRAYTADSGTLNPEPYAAETSFAGKWVIENQITGQNNLNYNPSNGPVVAPWVAWGPYIWADGLNPRSDGFDWKCQDVRSNDFTHPSSNGVYKVAMHLLAFLKTDPTATPWFLKHTVTGQPPTCAISADVTNGVAPVTANFSAVASDPDGTIQDYQWTFDDGTFSTNANPTKVFKTPGAYVARVTATDNDGNNVTRSLTVLVSAVSLVNPVFDGNEFHVSILGATNCGFVLQRSGNLSNWVSVATNHGPFTFAENISGPSGFYRAFAQP